MISNSAVMIGFLQSKNVSQMNMALQSAEEKTAKDNWLARLCTRLEAYEAPTQRHLVH